MKIRAKYVGVPSLGFVTGNTYEIKICSREIKIIPLGETISHIYVYDQNSTLWHPYKDEEEMLKNWRILE